VSRARAVRRAEKRAGPRPLRGDPDETRKRLVLAAAREIETHGYFGTDTNRIARAAGYAAGTFYKHFPDKRAVFLAVFEEWITREWAELSQIAAAGKNRQQTARALADAVIEHHRAWPGFRASLRALVALDPEVRRAHRNWRRRQVTLLRTWSKRSDSSQPLTLLLVERIADALSDGEAETIELSEHAARAFVAERILELL